MAYSFGPKASTVMDKNKKKMYSSHFGFAGISNTHKTLLSVYGNHNIRYLAQMKFIQQEPCRSFLVSKPCFSNSTNIMFWTVQGIMAHECYTIYWSVTSFKVIKAIQDRKSSCSCLRIWCHQTSYRKLPALHRLRSFKNNRHLMP